LKLKLFGLAGLFEKQSVFFKLNYFFFLIKENVHLHKQTNNRNKIIEMTLAITIRYKLLFPDPSSPPLAELESL